MEHLREEFDRAEALQNDKCTHVGFCLRYHLDLNVTNGQRLWTEGSSCIHYPKGIR
jgi:hypothetical protein